MKKVSLIKYGEKVPFNVVTCNQCSTSLELESEGEIVVDPHDYTKAFVLCSKCKNTIRQSHNSVQILEALFQSKKNIRIY